ncbi:MAG: bifunctional diaminohydroxyphosphoribosylaminopyrimidine deaminase/5-amino-6-(5-phosphoribosylamino)uracil reductase RibD [Actinobacteria bacterium]|nr:bifunctional diaminohydroxyphosphoribosylaminopyrimidine deaminase/5-amino-6-(5-phosphoribosylamino)uracil reductase RibD [Actinomycetota bacterium]
MSKPEPESEDERFMMRALELAENARGRTGPNPMVGAVVVFEGKIVGEGYHEVLGGPHAEVNALRVAGDKAKGATMHVTLEPCAHQGRTPPCVNDIVDARVSKVVMALRDPNPLVDGRGAEYLSEHGIIVEQGPYEEIARRQNEAYLKRIASGLPFVTLKMAVSLDGKMATRTGDSRWITSDESRSGVHLMRSWSDAIMVGIGTVLSDDPRLTVRMGKERARSPLRVVVDSTARTPIESRVAETSEAPTLVAVAGKAPSERRRALEENGLEVVQVGSGDRVDLRSLLELLSQREMANLLVEGGGDLAYGLWKERLVDKLVFFLAPRIIGGREAPGPIGGEGAPTVEESWTVSIDGVFRSGPDIRVIAYPAWSDEGCSQG